VARKDDEANFLLYALTALSLHLLAESGMSAIERNDLIEFSLASDKFSMSFRIRLGQLLRESSLVRPPPRQCRLAQLVSRFPHPSEDL
jgi:hypothetical protein